MIRLGALFFFLFCSNAMAEQTVITAYPDDNSFKFVWSNKEAVFSDQKTHLRCTFLDSFEGIDDGAEPYIAKAFTCEANIGMLFKQLKNGNKSYLLVLDGNGKVIGNSAVYVERKKL